MSKYILGLNIGNHDSAAALIKDGRLIKFIEQERISRHKMAIGEPPIEAILECLKIEGIQLKDIDAIAVGMDWQYRNKVYQMSEEEAAKYRMFADSNWFLPRDIFGNEIPPIHIVRHHLAHASSAYRVSGFDECAILVIDNRGEDASTSLAVGRNGEIKILKQINIHNSLGIFYNRAARYTGLYGNYREVGKFMGLASYGTPSMKMPLCPSRDKQLFKSLPYIEDETIFDSINIRTSQFADYFEKNCFPYQAGNVEEIMSYANFAASVQNALENTILDFVSELKEITGMNNLVIAGGVALNCSANGKIEQSGLFKNLYIPPFASDSGTAVGAALEVYHKLYGTSKSFYPLRLPNLGVSYSQIEIETILKKYKDSINYIFLDEDKLYDYVAEALVNGEIIAWMQSGFEAGPRALGCRSIIADSRTRRSLIKLNMIKEREMWRPIAPSVLYDNYSEYFEGNPESKYFMNVATLVKEEKRREIAAVVHVDNTARPQVVLPEHEKYYRLLSSFYKKTGVPVLCNTSFNTRGEPLVNSPEDAVECFLKREFNKLVIGNFVVEKI